MPDAFHSTIIPRSFRLGGFKIDVHIDDTLIGRENLVGQCRYREQEIRLDPGVGSVAFAERFYLSQLINWIFFMMGESELGNNERLVEGFAHFLYQALTTMEPLADEDDLPDEEPHWDEFEEVDYDPGCNDDCGSGAAWDLIQMEREEEEESRWEIEAGMAECSGYADAWTRSDEEGWFYNDDD